MRQRCFRVIAPLAALLALAAVPPMASAQPKSAAAAAPASGEPLLSAAQQAKMKARNQRFEKDLAALRGDTKMTQEQKNAKFQSLYAALDKDMLDILTPDQRAQVARARQAALAQRQQQEQGFAAFQKAHQSEISAAQSLGQKIHNSLTPAQTQQMDAIRSDALAQQKKIVTNKRLSDQAKRQQLLTLTQSAQAKSLDVLNAAQRGDFEKLQKMQAKLTKEAQAAGRQ